MACIWNFGTWNYQQFCSVYLVKISVEVYVKLFFNLCEFIYHFDLLVKKKFRLVVLLLEAKKIYMWKKIWNNWTLFYSLFSTSSKIIKSYLYHRNPSGNWHCILLVGMTGKIQCLIPNCPLRHFESINAYNF